VEPKGLAPSDNLETPRFEDVLREFARNGMWAEREEFLQGKEDALADAVTTLRLIAHDSSDLRARKFAHRSLARLDGAA
jgi:hypothetical protein